MNNNTDLSNEIRRESHILGVRDAIRLLGRMATVTIDNDHGNSVIS